MSNFKFFILLFTIFFCLTQVQRSHIYFTQTTLISHSPTQKIATKRLPKIELAVNLEDFLENNLEDIQNPNKMI